MGGWLGGWVDGGVNHPATHCFQMEKFEIGAAQLPISISIYGSHCFIKFKFFIYFFLVVLLFFLHGQGPIESDYLKQ